MYLCWGRN